MKKAKDVDEYIAATPKNTQVKLKQLRIAIRQVAPKSQEKISYGMPYYSYNGRLAYFRINKSHIGLYIPTPVIYENKKELKDYEITKATIRLPLDKKLPIALIKKLIRSRMRKNEED